MLAAAVASLVAATAASWPVGVLAGLAAAAIVAAVDVEARPWMLSVVVVSVAIVAVRADWSSQDLAPVDPGPVEGWATVVGDPRPFDRATRVVLRLDGSRLEVWARGTEQAIVERWRNGDRLMISAERRPLAPARAERVAWEHVVGELRDVEVLTAAPPSPLDRFSNEVRRVVDRGSSSLTEPHDALLRGLVIGDRRGLPSELIGRFRASGLSHLTVASGLNVALLLAAASPVLTRMRPLTRWVSTIVLVAWFASLTRFEPSILRASVMAAIASTAFVMGRDRSPVRLLALAVIVLLVVDPLLVRSVGFRLSVGATWGVAALGPRLAERLPGPDWIRRPLGVTLGAQVGVAPPLLASVGHVPVVSVPANLLAVPVASLVKLYGLPASIVAGLIPQVSGLVMAPCRFGVAWVDTVARVAASTEPGRSWSLAWWLLIGAGVGVAVARSGR